MTDTTVRPARDADAEQLIALVGRVFSEYPGVVLDVENEEPDLLAIASRYAEAGGQFWVVESDEGSGRSRGRVIVASVGLVPVGDGRGVQLRKLYVAGEARRRGLGTQLCELVETRARELGATYVELWSDTRFRDAHRLYRGRGYRQGEQTRFLHDLSNTEELYFRKEL